MYKIFGEVMKFIENTMENWIVGLTEGEKIIHQGENPERYIPRRYFSPLLFVIAMKPLSCIARKYS